MKLLVFDMGHVFIDFEWDEVCAGFCRASGRSPAELKAGMNHVAQLGYESGKVSTQVFLAELNNLLGITMGVDQFSELWVRTFRENQEMARLLAHLKTQRPLCLLSNTNEVHYEHLQKEFDVERHFDEIVLSYKVGLVKPDPLIYEEVLQRSGIPAEHCLFIDDLEANVAAARQVGMQAIQFQGVANLKAELSKFGLNTEL
ncbi:MAG: HAD family phosphatase [Candidatus Obscuribacterales bacterium]|nr:HAD family phosphatase [Candidatus Obscuribacterales bacterium]